MKEFAEHQTDQGRKRSFVGYWTAGFPNADESVRIMKACCDAGLNILEIGFPAQDASMDGEVIKKAQACVDKSLAQNEDYWRTVRQEIAVPIWLMGYKADLFRDAVYLRLAKERLYDAIVIPDMSQAEREALSQELQPFGISVVGFINSQQPREETDRALSKETLIYHQLYCGPTGVAHNDDSYLSLLHYAQQTSHARLFAGFGINSPERVEELLRNGFDGVIVGSAIMKLHEQSSEKAYQFIKDVHRIVRSVA